MTEEELAKIPRRTASEVLADIPGGPRYEERVDAAVAVAMNIEWWRGFYAGVERERKEQGAALGASVPEWARRGRTSNPI